jgi:methionyl-tRNA synthetase
LVKEDKNKAGNILFHCAEALRLSSILLSPVMPSKSEHILQILGTKEKSLVWGKIKPSSSITLSKPIFPRIN